MGLFELVQPDPLQLPQVGEHFTQCFLHVHLILLQSVWQLHLIIFRSSSEAGGKSVSTGISFPSLFFHPHSRGLILSLLCFSTPNKLGGCGILQQLKLVAGFIAQRI